MATLPWLGYLYIPRHWISYALRRRAGVNTRRRDFKLLVSLTSYPARLPSVFLTIESLLSQTLKPDRIILWLAKSELGQEEIPLRLRKQQERGLEIRFVNENLRSYKKLVYAVVAFSDHHIVTCDDDMMYPKGFLQGLYRGYRRHPDCIIAYRSRVMSRSGECQLSTYNQWPFYNRTLHNIPEHGYSIFPTANAGIWYPPHSLDAQISDRVFMSLCPTADDIWFKAMSLLARTKVVMAKSHSIIFPTIHIRSAQRTSLWSVNASDNDRQLKAVFDNFNLYHLIPWIKNQEPVSNRPKKEA